MTRWLLAIALTLVASPAAAQNGFSFLDAAQSAIDYRVASAGPRTACRDLLLSLSGSDLTVLSARDVAATDGAPAFCRVMVLIQPEVQVELALPSAWNRRLYMLSAQRFPGDFDGIIAGAPVLNFTDTMVWNLWNARALAARACSRSRRSARSARP